jgi:hypothetical protein
MSGRLLQVSADKYHVQEDLWFPKARSCQLQISTKGATRGRPSIGLAGRFLMMGANVSKGGHALSVASGEQIC